MASTTTATHQRWTDIPAETITDAISRRYITGDRVTVARFELKRGGVVPKHAHEHEQVSCVLSGSLRFVIDGSETVVSAGGVMRIPGHVPHEVTVLEDAVVLDVFSPIRQDWIAGTDTYFRQPR